MLGEKRIDTPVLIVGAGPVGLALAGDLGWRGIPSIVIEKTNGTIFQARQDLVGIRTMEFCRRWGIVKDVERSPYPRDYPQDNIYIAGNLVNGWEIGRYKAPSMDQEKPPEQSPQKRERCPQNMFDPILKKFALTSKNSKILYNHQFCFLEHLSNGIRINVEDTNQKRKIKIFSRYLVGCDGFGSQVREMLNIKMLGKPALTYTTNIIFRFNGFEKLHTKPPGYRFIFLKPGGVWATIVAINGRDQWRMSIVNSREQPGDLSREEIHKAIAEVVGVPFGYEILSILPWTRRELVADKYNVGNVFIAGDAAHVMSPTGGFGMNTGIGDIVDLSWKISATLKAWGGSSLMDSYVVERQPVAFRNVKEASGNLNRMLSKKDHPAFFDKTVEGAKARKSIGQKIYKQMQREWETLGIHLGYRYENSPICVSDGTPDIPDNHAQYIQTSRPGSRAPHVWLKDGRSTLDLFGSSFVLLCLGENVPKPDPFYKAAKSCNLPLKILHLKEKKVCLAYQSRLVLVRPDGHVAWRGDNLPKNSKKVIDTVRGAL